MTIVPRREIEELVALHEREPDLREVFVEGPSDSRLVEWFLSENGIQNIPVLEIATVDIPTEMVLQGALEDGNRGRVITLAEALSKNAPASQKVTCIIDADLDWLMGTKRECPNLLATDFATMEVYAFNEQAVSKILRLVLGGFAKTADVVLRELAVGLQELFLLRAANHLEKLGLDFDSPSKAGFYKSFRLTESGLQFDSDKFVTAILQAHKATKKKPQVVARVADLRPKLKRDPRFQINGHDFEQLFALYVRKHRGFGGTHPDLIVRSILATIEVEMLRQQNLFRKLLQRCSPEGD